MTEYSGCCVCYESIPCAASTENSRYLAKSDIPHIVWHSLARYDVVLFCNSPIHVHGVQRAEHTMCVCVRCVWRNYPPKRTIANEETAHWFLGIAFFSFLSSFFCFQYRMNVFCSFIPVVSSICTPGPIIFPVRCVYVCCAWLLCANAMKVREELYGCWHTHHTNTHTHITHYTYTWWRNRDGTHGKAMNWKRWDI